MELQAECAPVALDAESDESIEQRIARLCGHLNAIHAQLVETVAEAIETDAWHGWGIKTAAHWVAWQTGLSPSRARTIVNIAQRRNELPATYNAFTNGEIAIDQIAVVAKYVPAAHDSQVADLARHATVTQLAKAVSRYTFTPPPEPSPFGTTRPTDFVNHHTDEGGRFTLSAECDALCGATITQALHEAHDHLFRNGRPQATWVDALTLVCERSLATVTSVSRTDRFRTLIHLDTEGAFLHQGPRLPDRLAQHITCNGVVQPVWTTGGHAVNVGRARRIVPERTRRLIEHRDQHCQHPTCNSHHHLDIHHITHWLDGGPTITSNLIALCGNHHQSHHNGEFHISGNADIPQGVTFSKPNGDAIKRPLPTPPAEPPPEPIRPYKHPTGETLQTHWLTFTPATAVDVF